MAYIVPMKTPATITFQELADAADRASKRAHAEAREAGIEVAALVEGEGSTELPPLKRGARTTLPLSSDEADNFTVTRDVA